MKYNQYYNKETMNIKQLIISLLKKQNFIKHLQTGK